MRRSIGQGCSLQPWPCLFSLADTGGSASLRILGPAGEAGVGGPAAVPPPVLLQQTADLFHDPDGDGPLGPGDM